MRSKTGSRTATTVIYYVLGVVLIVGFVLLYWTRFTDTPMLPPLIRAIYERWGRIAVLAVNALVFLIFLVFLPYRNHIEWKSKGVLGAFVVALFAEMFGIPLLIYLLHPLLGSDLTLQLGAHFKLKLFSHYLFFGWVGAVIGAYLTLAGMAIVFVGWAEVYRAEGIVMNGLYRYARHPQYFGIFLVITGWILAWPTLLTFVLYPILLVVYHRLARREEKDMVRRYGEAYECYSAMTPMYLPLWVGRKRGWD